MTTRDHDGTPPRTAETTMIDRREAVFGMATCCDEKFHCRPSAIPTMRFKEEEEEVEGQIITPSTSVEEERTTTTTTLEEDNTNYQQQQ